MVKYEWGMVRKCESCVAVFYDFWNTSVVCPSCGNISESHSSGKKRGKTKKSSHRQEQEQQE